MTDTLTGNLRLNAEKGRFLRANPGVAKLIGVLSLQSLVSFGLRDLFREGFAYDTITASAATGGTFTASNYTISYVTGTLTVNPAALIITADNQTKVYGAALPTLTASYSGFVNGDTSASLTSPPTLTSSATAT